jgi:hypothetical protein
MSERIGMVFFDTRSTVSRRDSRNRNRTTKKRKNAKKGQTQKKKNSRGFFHWLSKKVVPSERDDWTRNIGVNIRSVRNGLNLTVQFPSVTTTKDMKEVSLRTLEKKPIAMWDRLVENKPITFICWNPDPLNGTFVHWLTIDIQGGTVPEAGRTWFSWLPPQETGVQRYYFGIFLQEGALDMTGAERRGAFPLPAFIERNKLKLVDWVVISSRSELFF